MNAPGANRKLLTFLVIIPLAIYLGWTLSEPLSRDAVLVVAALAALLLTPVMLRWHRPVLVFSWNATFALAFLPGTPPLWMPVAAASLLIIILEAIMDKRIQLLNVQALNRILFVLLAVVMATAYIRGGIGLKAMGSAAVGGKKYIYIFMAIAGYFALSTARIPREKVGRYTGMFFLSSLTSSLSNLVYLFGPAFYWVYFFIPASGAAQQAAAELAGAELVRLGGFTFAAIGICHFLLAKYSLRQILSLERLWLPLLLLVVLAVGALGGFRSMIIQLGMVFVIKFLLERLLFTRIFWALTLVGAIGLTLAVPLADRLPLSIQRAFSFLPFNFDPAVKMDAWASTEWRLQMWSLLLDDIPKYLLVGKGYVINPTDMFMVQIAQQSGFAKDFEGSLIAGDYHSGPLSVLINFGVAGAVVFLVFCWVGLRMLYRNFKYGGDSLRNLNGLIFASFLAKVVFFIVVFGDFASDLAAFCGLLGFSVALNGGVREKAGAPMRAGAPPALAPGGLAPVGAGMATARLSGSGRAG